MKARRAWGRRPPGAWWVLLAPDHPAGCAAHQADFFRLSGERVMMDNSAIVFDSVSKSFGAKQVLSDVSWSVPEGEAVCILGRSGTGKSVTLKLIVSLLKPDQGKIWVDQEEITGMGGTNLSRVRRKMGFLFQDAALFDSLTLVREPRAAAEAVDAEIAGRNRFHHRPRPGAGGVVVRQRQDACGAFGRDAEARRVGSRPGARAENPSRRRAEQRTGSHHCRGDR